MVNKSIEVVIVNAFRTPIGAYKGALKDIRSDQLGSMVIKEVLKKSKFIGDDIDEVIMGQVLTAGAGQNPARQAAINAGIPISKPAHLINQVCGSGLRAVISGYQSIKLGESSNIIVGGQENMSITPHSIFYRDKKKILEDRLLDTMIYDGLTDAFNKYHMGVTAENIANKFNISREAQDEYALISQKKTEDAVNNNRFNDELIRISQNDIFLHQDEQNNTHKHEGHLAHLGFNADQDAPCYMTKEVVKELGEQIEKGFADYHAEDGFFWGQQFQEDSVKEYKEQDMKFLKFCEQAIDEGKVVEYWCSW